MAKRTLGDSPGEAAPPTPAEVRSALECILRSRCFEHAGRASDFLRFVVGKTLAGEADQIKGYAIAVEVFGRPVDFDAQSDPLVRVEALRLRQRLTEYYAGEGAGDRVRLELPRGGYAIKAAYAPAPPREEAAETAPQRFARSALWHRKGAWAAAVAALMAIAAVGATLVRQPWASVETEALPVVDRSHLTKIIVVPLENLSTKPAFDGLAAGLTEELMLRLDALDLYVIAMQAKWYRPSKALDGVLGLEHAYVLTGSVREYSGGARITLRIIEAETGAQIWSAAYDEPPGIEEEPARQAKIAATAAAAAGLFGPVFDAELALVRRSSHTLTLPDCQTRYRAFRRATDPALFPEALACFQSLVARQPKLSHAWAGLAMLFIDEHVYYSGSNDGGSAFARARDALDMALELERDNVTANIALGRFHYYSASPEFPSVVDHVLALDPDNAETVALFGILLTAYGDATHGLELMTRANNLSPQTRPVYDLAYVFANLQKGDACEALAQTRRMEDSKWFIAHMVTAAAAGLCGDEKAAAQARKRLLAVAPNFEEEALGLIGVWQFEPRLRAAVLEGLARAGLTLPTAG